MVEHVSRLRRCLFGRVAGNLRPVGIVALILTAVARGEAGAPNGNPEFFPSPYRLAAADDSNNKNRPSLDVGKEFGKFSEQVAQRVDKIVRKKAFDLWGDPWTIQGIPLIFPSSDNGFNLGVKVALQNIRRQDPHSFELEAQVLASDLGRYKHFVKFDYPHALDGKFRITTRLSYDRDISLRYYGMGNDTSVVSSEVNNSNPLYQKIQAAPEFTFQLFRYLGDHVRLGPIIGFKWTSITAPPGSLLLSQSPTGINGGRTHYVGFGIVNDTTDFEPYPSRGSVNELYGYWYAPFMGSEYNFQRYTYTYRQYYPVHRTLILAHRFLFEVLNGNIPFYEQDAVGGSDPQIAFEGSRYLRGYDANRFVDNIRFSFSIEARWDPIEFNFARQDIDIGFVPFIDIARVWHTILPVQFNDFHATAGWGVRILWDNRFVIRGDLAVTPEGVAAYVDLGNSF